MVQVWRGAEDGRLMRVLTRLCFVLERPEADTDPQWAETGVHPLPCPSRAEMLSPGLKALLPGGQSMLWQDYQFVSSCAAAV